MSPSPFGQPQGRLDFSAYGQGEPIPLKDLQYSMPMDERADPSVMSQFFGTGSPEFEAKIGSLGDLSHIMETNAPVGMGSSGSMSSSGIGSLLQPIIDAAKQQSHQDLQGRITPYVEQVTQLTNQFFPNVSLSGQGMNQGVGGFFGGINPVRQNQISQPIQSSPNQNSSPFGIGSFFR